VIRAASALLAAILIGAPAAQADPAGEANLKRQLKAFTDAEGGPPGVIATLRRDDSTKVFTAGVGDTRTRRRPRAGDHMRIASVAKAFSGAVALELVKRGQITLDDTIASRRPDLPAAWGAVTVRQMLGHTSGLSDYTRSKGFAKQFEKTPGAFVSPTRIIDWVRADGLEFPPGTKYEYSNTDNIVVGLLVEEATGGSYDAALQSLVFGPLGLTQTSLPAGFRMPAPYVHGYDVQPPAAPQDLSTVISQSLLWAAGGMVTTASEVNTFIRGYAGGPRLFNDAVRAQQLDFIPGGRSQPPGPGKNSAGLALFRYETRCGTVFGHTGNLPGYTQFAATSPDGASSVVVSVNEQLSPDIEGKERVFAALRRVYELAVCSALVR